MTTPLSCCEIPQGPTLVRPDMATHWLEHHNQGNRNISKYSVAKLAAVMRGGRWMLTHQGIAFDENNFLLDGQHRSAAIVESGTPVWIHISTGMARETFKFLDIQRRRQAGQMIDHPQATAIASAARIVGPITGVWPRTNVNGGVYEHNADNDQILSLVEDWPELQAFASVVRRCHSNRGINASTHLAVVAMASRTRYQDGLGSWFDGLIQGVGLGANDPRLQLINRFSGQRERRLLNSSTGRPPAYHLIVKAWNAHALGNPIGTLRYGSNEGIPAITGWDGAR